MSAADKQARLSDQVSQQRMLAEMGDAERTEWESRDESARRAEVREWQGRELQVTRGRRELQVPRGTCMPHQDLFVR